MNDVFSKLRLLGSSNFQKFEISEFTIRKLKNSSEELTEILLHSGKMGQPKVDHYKEVLTFFYDRDLRAIFFSNSSSVKKLCWALDYRDDEFPESILEKGLLVQALGFIDKFYTGSCLTALIYVLFNNWEKSQVQILRSYIKNRIQVDHNERPKLKYYREKIDYICQISGPAIWAKDTFQSLGGRIDHFFDLNPYISFVKGSKYFKLFLIELFENIIKNASITDRDNWQEIINLAKANFDRNTLKYLISAEIVRFKEEIRGTTLQDVLKNRAFEQIGDPGKESIWILPDTEYSTRQIQVVQEARKILNLWINESLVDLFFSEVVEDLTRKRFWMQYVSKMATVDIFLSGQKLEEIFQDSRVRNGMEQRFGVLSSGGNTSSIIIFTIQKYRFVLAGSLAGGALYVHPNTSALYPKIEELRSEWPVPGRIVRRLDKNTLIHSYLSSLISDSGNYLYFQDEGRMIHTGNWQYRLRNWMENKIR